MTAAPGEADPTLGVRQLFGDLSLSLSSRRPSLFLFAVVCSQSQSRSTIWLFAGAVKATFGEQLTTMTTGFGWRETGKFPPLDLPLDIMVELYYGA